MKEERLILTKEDFEFLMKFYLSPGMSVFNKTRLSKELQNAKIVEKEWLPANVICSDSTVLVHNVVKSQTFNINIISSGSEINSNDIPVDDPLAIALLGYASTAFVEWEMGDGINKFQVISVQQKDLIEDDIWCQ